MSIGIKKYLAVAILVIANILAIYLIYNFQNTCRPSSVGNFDLLSEKIAWMDVEDFNKIKKDLTISYAGMKIQVLDYFSANNITGRYSLYFEDMTTGAWIGVAERDKFVPASLLKLPIMFAVLKKVELSELSLDQEVVITKDYLDDESGTLYTKGEGYVSNVRELLIYLAKESDNTAIGALLSLVDDEEIGNAWFASGLPKLSNESEILVSPKEYSNIFRSLYFSTYLRRTYSQLALSILSDTDRSTQLVAGVPSDVKVAHKYGAFVDGGYFHDCGIVYVPNKPYMLCVMSRDSSRNEADEVISGLSTVIYNYISK
jgi:beta-lactamase class A